MHDQADATQELGRGGFVRQGDDPDSIAGLKR